MTDPNPNNRNEAAASADDSAHAQAETSGEHDQADGDLARLQRERDELYDRLLRKSAEFDN